MARSYNVVEINKFNAGLITDASPLTTPDNSSLDEDNFVLNIDGSRNRRLGMDLELNHEEIETDIVYTSSEPIKVRSFRWDNAGGDPERYIQVVQIGNSIDFFHMDNLSVSTGHFHRETFPGSSLSTRFSFSVVDGILVAVNGDKDVYLFEYSDVDTITRSTRRLQVRDFFGVEDIIDGVNMFETSGIQIRPSTLSNNHIYNLRNQSWGIPRVLADGLDGSSTPNPTDPILGFYTTAGNRFPSNSDTVTQSLYPNPENATNRHIDRFFPEDLFKNPIGATRAPSGYFIIDALDRGISRKQRDAENRALYPSLSYDLSTLPDDQSTSGSTTIAEFAGRIFYGGFSGEVVDGDQLSPRMSSYILFSKVVDNINDIGTCYQEGDPTSKDFPDIIATDGGFIRINEAYDIQRLVNLGGSLMVVAKNGVWRIVGGTDNGFTATAYIVEKISDKGCTSPDSIVVIDNSVMFWSDDAIYYIAPDEFGSWKSNNLSFGRIQRLYDSINIGDKRNAYGDYDSYERKVRWLFYNSLQNENEVRELVLDLQLQSFYTNSIKQLNSETYPKPVAMYLGLSYQIDSTENAVLVGDDPVVVGMDNVVISSDELQGISQRELGYVIVTSIDGNIRYSFGKYSNTDFKDWHSVDNVGVDADAYLITSYISGGDFQRDKQLPYITIHLRRTENGVDEDSNPINQSSCLVQARWNWSDSDRSGKWGREFQAYRYRRLYLPQNNFDDYDNGFSTVVSRNKLRGSGKVLSLRFRTEPGKNLHLYGWSIILSVSENV